jgi:membrane protease YdiL (CAAX protease family)
MNYIKAFLIILFLFLIQIFLQIGFLRLFNFAFREYINIDFLTIYYISIGIISLLTTYILGIKVFKIKLNLKNSPNKLTNISLKFFLYLIIISIGLRLINRPFLDLNYILMELGFSEVKPFAFSELTTTGTITRIITYLIIAPIFEEIIFRKYIFTELLKKHTILFSIIISSVYFSLFHIPSYNSLIPTFIFGIIACIIYIKTKNIIYPIILHLLNNLIVLIFQLKGKLFYDWNYDLNFNITYWIIFTIGLIITIFGVKKITTANNAQKKLLNTND